jgi:hypothetical protein
MQPLNQRPRRDAWKVNDTVKQKCCGTLDKYHLTRVARRHWHCLARRCPLMRAMNMPGVVPQAARMARNLGEFIQDAAVSGVLRFPAQLSQTLELLFQRPQFPNTLPSGCPAFPPIAKAWRHCGAGS